MKKQSIRSGLLVLVLGAISVSPVMADAVFIRVGNDPPPPLRYERPWARPYANAVWISGHNEWRGGRYVWVPGYYTYPPRGEARWIGPRYQHTPHGYYYRPGHWAY